jgi:lipopolysaccharide transport system ATP-binding protein
MEGAPSAIKLSEYQNRTGNADLKVVDCHVFNSDGQSLSIIETFKDFRFKLFYDLKNDLRLKSFRIDIGINNILGERVAWFSTLLIKKTFDLKNNNQIEFLIRKFPLSPGDYNCNIYIEINNEISDYLINVVPFKIIELDYYGTGFKAVNHNQGKVLLDIDYVI